MRRRRQATVIGLAGLVFLFAAGAGARGADAAARRAAEALRGVLGRAKLRQPRERLAVRLDRTGACLLLATPRAHKQYQAAIAEALKLHPQAARATLDPARIEAALDVLRKHTPRYVLIFILPEELDVNFAWKWLGVTTRVDDDPLVDVRTGFITGPTAEAAAGFVGRIGRAARGEIELPGKLIDNRGANPSFQQGFHQGPGCMMLPVFGERVALEDIAHGTKAFTEARLASMKGAGLVHFGGHGYPDRIVDGVQGAQAGRLELSPCVVFNGACYTGVTGTWFMTWGPGGKVARHAVAAKDCFCLNLLGNSVVAYLAALHPDHGVPVYQEMEFLAHTGAPLGDVIKHTHDGVVLGFGGTLPEIAPLRAGTPSPRWTPAEMMLKGTAARVLFGDPALVVMKPFAPPPFRVAVAKAAEGKLTITAVLENTRLMSTYTDTYHADLAANKQQFNDRALVVADLPAGWGGASDVKVLEVKAAGRPLKHRLVAWAVEADGTRRRLHAQVDLPTTAYMQSPFRRKGAAVVLSVTR